MTLFTNRRRTTTDGFIKYFFRNLVLIRCWHKLLTSGNLLKMTNNRLFIRDKIYRARFDKFVRIFLDIISRCCLIFQLFDRCKSIVFIICSFVHGGTATARFYKMVRLLVLLPGCLISVPFCIFNEATTFIVFVARSLFFGFTKELFWVIKTRSRYAFLFFRFNQNICGSLPPRLLIPLSTGR